MVTTARAARKRVRVSTAEVELRKALPGSVRGIHVATNQILGYLLKVSNSLAKCLAKGELDSK